MENLIVPVYIGAVFITVFSAAGYFMVRVFHDDNFPVGAVMTLGASLVVNGN